MPSGAASAQPEAMQETVRHLLRMVISRNERMLELAERYLTIEDLLAVRRRMIGTGLVGGKATGMLVARAILRRAARALAGDPRAARFLLRGFRRLLFVPRQQRLLAPAAETARQRQVPRRRGARPGADARRLVPGVRARPVCGDAGLLRPGSHRRALVQPARGQLRERLFGQVRERLLRQPGLAAGAPGGIPGGGAPYLRQRHGARRPALSRPTRPARPRRADGAAGPARIGGHVRPSFLPAGGRGRAVVQPLRLVGADRPQSRRPAAGLRPGHPRRPPVRRRLHAHRGAQRARTPAGDDIERGARICAMARGRSGSREEGAPARVRSRRSSSPAASNASRWLPGAIPS